MKDETYSGENMPNLPRGMDELAAQLDAMSIEEVTEELEILLADMDEDSFDGELLDVYLAAIRRKSPETRHVDTRTSYKLFSKRVKAEESKTEKRRFRGARKAGLIAAAVIAVLVASMVAAQAAGFDLIDRIVKWTAETFGFASSASSDSDEVPEELEGMKEALLDRGISTEYLPTYWPDGYEQSQLLITDEPEAIKINGVYGDKQNSIILSYTFLSSGSAKVLYQYNIDDSPYEVYTHNGKDFYIMTNIDKFIAVWNSETVEFRISEVSSYDELIKILDSIGA